MRFCVGDEPECNGPECGHAETCPYYLSEMKEDSSLKKMLDDWIRNNKGVNRVTPTETDRSVSRVL